MNFLSIPTDQVFLVLHQLPSFSYDRFFYVIFTVRNLLCCSLAKVSVSG